MLYTIDESDDRMCVFLTRQPNKQPNKFVEDGNFSVVVMQKNNTRFEFVFPHGETVSDILEGDLIAVVSEAPDSKIRETVAGFLGLPDVVEIKIG